MSEPSLLTAPGDEPGFRAAYEQAVKSFEERGVPVGAALSLDGEVIAAGHNERVQKGDPIAHGEMSCIRNAGRRRDYDRMTLYTTLSPCPMCSGTILLFGIGRVVVGEATNFSGDLDFLRSHGVEVVLLDDPACIELMARFQRELPEVWLEDIGR